MTTRELRNRVRGVRRGNEEDKESKAEAQSQGLPPELLDLQERLSQELGAPVKIQQHGNTGKIKFSNY